MKYLLLTCNKCEKEFKHPYGKGHVPGSCPKCSNEPKLVAMIKPATTVNFECRGCFKHVSEPRARGPHPQVNCKECREKPKVTIRKTIPTPIAETPKYRARLCSDCKNPFTFQVKRGKQPIKCVPCREKSVNVNKAKVTTELKCIICENNFPKPKKHGKPNSICPTCLNKAGKITEAERDVLLQPRYTGAALAEYLDNKLKALGIHFSQHEDRKWA